MDSIRYLEQQYGGRWCGIQFDFGERADKKEIPGRASRALCSAAVQPHQWPVVLTEDTVECPGCAYAFGWKEEWELLTGNISEFSGLPERKAASILQQAPVLGEPCSRVTVGVEDNPDVLISFAQPETVMKIIMKWQQLFGWQVVVETSSFMSVCSAVAVRARAADQVCISFGCPKSRSYSNIGRDRMVVGLNNRLVESFFQADQKIDYIEQI